MKILYLTSWLPFPLNTGARVRNYYLIKYLSEKHEIDLLTFIFSREEEANIPGLRDICQRVKAVLSGNRKCGFREKMLTFFSFRPKSIHLSWNTEIKKSVYDWTAEKKYDLIIVDSLMMAEYILDIKNIPMVFDHHNIDAIVLKRDYELQTFFLKKLRRWLTWKKGEKYEAIVNREIEAHTVVSGIDRNKLLELNPQIRQIEIIPNGVDLAAFVYYEYEKCERDFSTIIFCSLLKYQANLDGLCYFCEKIFPIIKASRPDIKLIVTGDYSNLPIDDLLNDKSIEFTGYVDDIKKMIAKAGVSVVPLRIGSGTRFKILESMAIGTPVISTSIGAEGIEGLKPVTLNALDPRAQSLEPRADFNILIADKPEDFAEGVLTLLSDKQLAVALSRNARKLVEEKYGWETISTDMVKFLEEVKEGCQTSQ